jgi:hypothetical protein
LAHASLERQLAALTATKNDLEKKLREKDVAIDRLEKDRRWLAEREQEEREEKERERIEWDEAKVSSSGYDTFLLIWTDDSTSGNQTVNYERSGGH